MQALMMKPWLFGSFFCGAITLSHAVQTIIL